MESRCLLAISTISTRGPEAVGRLPLSSLPLLSSRPGAPRTLFLDFDGDAAATWNNGAGTYQVSGPAPGNGDPVPAFDWDGNASDFSSAELTAINTIWQIVAEKYSPFNINVTTVDPGNVTNDVTEKVIIGGSPRDWFQPNPNTNPTPNSGVSAIGGFYDPNLPNTAYVFGGFYTNNSFFVGNVAAHEAGHAFGLVHERSGPGSPPTEYYAGDATRVPIMGDSGNQGGKRGIWWLTNMEPGQQSPDGIQDELIKLDTVLGYRADDHGNDFNSADPLAGTAGEIYGSGVIERASDVDYFSFNATTSSAQITIAPDANAPMLAPRAELYTSGGSFIASGLSDGQGHLTISANNLTPGASYRVMVAGQGDYGDMGQYSITGSLGKFASLNTTYRTIFVQGVAGLADNISIYADPVQGKIVISDNGGTQSWGVNFVDDVVVTLADGLNDRIDLLPINPLGNPHIYVYSGGGSDELNVYGTANVFPSSGNDVITVNSSTITVAADGALYTELDDYRDIELVNVWGDVGNDQFHVSALRAGTSLILYGQDGNDTASVGEGELDAIFGNVSFSGGNGSDSLVLDDANHAGARNYLLSLGFVGVNAIQFGYGSPTTESVTINGAAGGATVDAAAVLSGINWIFNGGNGNDNFVFGGSFQNVTAATQGAITVNGGGGNDTLTFNDQGGTSDFTVGPTDVFFVGTPGIVHFSAGTENVVINGGSAGNYFNIDGPGIAVAVQINAGGGNDTISIAATSARLDYIGADVSVDGQGGTDTLFIHNANGPARNETLTPTSVNDGSHTFTYAGIESLSIDLSQLDETMYIVGTSAAAYTTIYANNGNDTCYFLTSDLAGTYGLAYWGQGGSNTATLNDQSATGAHTYDIGPSLITRGSFSFTFGGLTSLTLNASNTDETINLNGVAQPTVINAGPGADTVNVAGSGFNGVSVPNVTISGGDGYDQLLFDDAGGPNASTWSISATSVSRSFSGSFFYDTMDALHVTGNASGETFIVRGTASGCNVALYGQGGADSYIMGGLSFQSPTLDNIVTLVQVFDSGSGNSLTLNDTADTTGDTVRAEAFLINNGPGAPLFGVGGWVNYYGVSSMTLNLGSGADTIYFKPTNQNACTINAANPTSAPGDTLNLAFAAVTNPVFTPGGVGAGGYTFGNAEPLNYTGIESTAIDSVAPAVNSRSFNFNSSPQAIEFAFSEDVSATLTPYFLTLTNLTTGQPIPQAQMALSYNNTTNLARFTFPSYPFGALPNGNYHAVLSYQVADLFGNVIGQDQTLDFFVLAADANHDRAVDITDLSILATNWQGSAKSFAQGDFNYDGTVDISDLAILATNWQATLAAPPAPGLDFGVVRMSLSRPIIRRVHDLTFDEGAQVLPG